MQIRSSFSPSAKLVEKLSQDGEVAAILRSVRRLLRSDDVLERRHPNRQTSHLKGLGPGGEDGVIGASSGHKGQVQIAGSRRERRPVQYRREAADQNVSDPMPIQAGKERIRIKSGHRSLVRTGPPGRAAR